MRLHNYQDEDTIEPNFDIFIPCDLNIEKDTPEWETVIKRLKEFYFDKKGCSKSVLEKYSLVGFDKNVRNPFVEFSVLFMKD